MFILMTVVLVLVLIVTGARRIRYGTWNTSDASQYIGPAESSWVSEQLDEPVLLRR
jgi:hypothetical protein